MFMYFTKSMINIPTVLTTQTIEIKVWRNYLVGWQFEEDQGTAETAWATNGSLEDTYEPQNWKPEAPHSHWLDTDMQFP